MTRSTPSGSPFDGTPWIGQSAASPPPSPSVQFLSQTPPLRINSPSESIKRKRRISGVKVTSFPLESAPGHVGTTSSHGSGHNEPKTALAATAAAAAAASRRNSSVEKVPHRIHRPKSAIDLPTFRKDRPKFYWLSGPELEEVVVQPLIQNPSWKFGYSFCHSWVGKSDKSIVYAGKFHKEDGSEEWLAIKVVQCDSDKEFNEAHREVRLLQNLEHNHLIAIVGAYKDEWHDDDDEPRTQLGILLFPLAPQNLIDRLSKLSKHNARRSEHATRAWRPHPGSTTLLTYFPCLCRAVLYLHAHRIKHRDVKPGNILIDSSDTVILTDLDIAKQYRSMIDAVTYGKVRHTRQYAPKNVIHGRGGHGFSWDINSLGFVFLEMANVIFGETSENMFHYLIGDEKCIYCGNYGHMDELCPKTRIDRNMENSEEPADEDEDEIREQKKLVYSEALDSGRIDEWVKHLRSIPGENPSQLPLDLFRIDGNLQSNRFLDMILDMMRALEEQRQVLKTAWALFSTFATKDCTHCHPKHTKYGCAEPNYLLDLPSEASSFRTSTSSPGPSEGLAPQASTNATSAVDSVSDGTQSEAESPVNRRGQQDDQQPALGKESSQEEAGASRPLLDDQVDKMSKNVPEFTFSRASTLSYFPQSEIPGPSDSPTDGRDAARPAFPDSAYREEELLSHMAGFDQQAPSNQFPTKRSAPEDDTETGQRSARDFQKSPDVPAATNPPDPHSTPTTGASPQTPLRPGSRGTFKRVIRIWTFNGGPREVRTLTEFDQVTDWIIVYDHRRKEDVTIQRKSFVETCDGVLIRMPRNNGSKFRLPKGEFLDLKRKLTFTMNMKRRMGHVGWIFVCGSFDEDELRMNIWRPRSHT